MTGANHGVAEKKNDEAAVQNQGLGKEEGAEFKGQEEEPSLRDLNKEETENIKELLKAVEEKRAALEEKGKRGDSIEERDAGRERKDRTEEGQGCREAG